MNSHELEASFCHHIACNGAVDAARNEKSGSACRARGHTARTLELFAVDISAGISDLDGNNDVGVMNINLKMREFSQKISARFSADLGGFEGKLFVGTLCFNLVLTLTFHELQA